MAMEAAISASMSHPNVVQTFSCELVPIKRSHLTKEQARKPMRRNTTPNLNSAAEDVHDEANAATENDVGFFYFLAFGEEV